MLVSRTLTGSARVAVKGPQVSMPELLWVAKGSFGTQAFRRYASAAPTAAFAGQKGANVCLPCPL